MALVGGGTEGVDRAAADRHLAGCQRCRQLVAEAMRESSIEGLETAPASPGARAGQTRRVLQYDIIRELGRGGMGQVVLARDTRLGRQVAIKFLHDTSASLAKRFLAEARTTAQLHHENIVVIHEVNEHEGQPFMVLEYLEGHPLSALVRQGPVPWRRAVELVMPVLQALAHAHEHGIVHRDLKPDNVFVTSKGVIKVLDFGIARAFAAAQGGGDQPAEQEAGADPARRDLRLTRQGAMIGTLPYMSPEQHGMDEVDARTDIWAVGLILFELIANDHPLAPLGREKLMRSGTRLDEEMPSLRDRVAGVPEALVKVVDSCLRKRKLERIGSAGELTAALTAAAGLAVAAPLPRLPEHLRDLWVTSGPQPLAVAISVLDAARNVHQARDALWSTSRIAVRTLALIALACRTGRDADRDRELERPFPIDLVRALRRQGLKDQEWLALARELVRPFRDAADSHRIPALVGLLQPADESGDLLERLLERKFPTEGGARGEEQVRQLVADGLVALAELLRQATFLLEYRLGVSRQGWLESWMGLPRPRRPIIPRREQLPDDQAVLVDRGGRLVVSLHPLVQVARPAPGHDEEMFLLEGGSAAGALLVSLPVGYERHDDGLWAPFGEGFLSATGDDLAQVADDDLPPYRGLASFTRDDADRFFGRERRIDSVVNRLRVEPLLAIVGPSGAGKTSFVQAGLVPRLPSGWWALTARPGRAPIASLETALRGAGVALPGDLEGALAADPDALGTALRATGREQGTVVVCVEQFEELFTLCPDADQQRLYLEGLTRAARNGDDPVRVILTLRDDFLVRAQSAPALRDRLSQAVEILTTPDRSDLLRILVEPAHRAGYDFDDPALPAEMVEAVVDKPGGLALLSFTAASLWEARDRATRSLTRSGYQALGGVGGALAQHAETMLATLAREQKNLVREAFRHLITAEGTRATLSRSDLVQLLGGGDDSQAVLERLIGARLLVAQEGEAGEDRIEIVHEALVSAWPRLAEWVREDAEGARSRDHLRTAARQWDERARPRALLMRDEALADYRRWQSKSPAPLTALERTFADASLREDARGRRIRRISLATIALAASGALVTLLWLNGRAKEQRLRAEDNLLSLYEEQGRQALLARDYFRALPYLSAARTGGRSGPALRFMLAEALRPLRQRPLVIAHQETPTWVAFSPDGTQLLTSSQVAPVATLWSTDGRLLHTLKGDERADVLMATFDPSGTLVATAGRDGTARIWSAHDGTSVARLPHPRPVVWVAFSPSGDRLATACLDGHVRIFSRAGALLADLDTGSSVAHLSWSPSGDRLASAGEAGARLWNSASGALLRTLDEARGPVMRVEFAPDGQTIATGSADGIVRLHRLGPEAALSLPGHRAAINDLAFSPDGARLVSASADGTARLWQVPGGDLIASLDAHGDAVSSAVFSPDGARVLTGSFDGTARLWDRDGTPLGVLVGHSSLVYRAVFDPTGERIATVATDSSARIWSAAVHSTVRFLVGHQGPVYAAAFSSDGRRLLSLSSDGSARVWDVRSGRELRRMPLPRDVSAGVFLPGDRIGWVELKRVRIEAPAGGPGGTTLEVGSAIRTAEASPRGDRLLTITYDRHATVWDVASGARVATFPALSARFGQDGRTVPAIGIDGQLEVWDGVTGRRRLSIRAHRGPTWYALACDGGRRILSVGADGTLRHWDAASGALLRSVSLKVNYVGFEVTGDCNFIAAMGDHHLATLIDAVSGQALNFIDSHTADAVNIIVDPGGTRVAALDGNRVGVWDLELANEPPEKVAALTRCAVPFRVVGAEFVPAATHPSDCGQE